MKGMLGKNTKNCFILLWTGKKEREGIPLFKLEKLAKPRGEGLKNIQLFEQALDRKKSMENEKE